MSRFPGLLALALLVAWSGTAGAAPAPATTDANGDPLPAGAVARIGGVRLRHTGEVTTLAFAGGKLLASASADGSVRLWDVASGKEVRRIALDAGKSELVGQRLAVSADGKLVGFTSQGQAIHVWDAASGKEAHRLDGPNPKGVAPVLAFAPDGKTLAWWGNDGTVRLWDLTAGKELRRWAAPRGFEPRFAFAPDGKTLAVSTGRATALVEVSTGKELHRLTEERSQHYAAAFSPDGKVLATGGAGEVRLWDVATGAEKRRLEGHVQPVQWLGFTADGKGLVASAADGAVRTWDLSSGKELHSTQLPADKGVANPVARMAVSPDGRTVAWVAWGETNRIRLTDAATGTELSPRGDAPGAGPVAFPDGKGIVTAGRDGRLRLWSTATGKEQRAFEVTDDQSLSFLGFSVDGKTLVSAGKAVTVWDPAAGKALRRWDLSANTFSAPCALSPDGKVLAVGEVDRSRRPTREACHVQLWDLATGKAVRSPEAHDGSVGTLAFSADGKKVASVGWGDHDIFLWDAASGKVLARHPASDHHGFRLAFTADGKALVSAQSYFDAGRGAVRVVLRDPATAKEMSQVAGLPGGTSLSGLSPDGKYVALAGDGGAVRVWDMGRGKEVATLKGEQGTTLATTFAADGRLAATTGSDGTILIWDLVALAGRE